MFGPCPYSYVVTSTLARYPVNLFALCRYCRSRRTGDTVVLYFRPRKKEEDTIWVLAANVNCFSLDRRGGQYDNFCRVLRAAQVDIACGQEHNLETTKLTIRSILHNTTQQHWRKNRIDFASIPLKFKNLYKPSGTFIISTGNVTSHLCGRFQDKWGRWTSQTYRGRAGSSLTVISAYQVVTDTPARGTSTTAAAQQYSLILQTQDQIRAPWAAFCRDLTKYIKECQSTGHEVFLMGDFNECIGQDPDGMKKVIEHVNWLISVIHLYKVDYNMAIGLKWRAAVYWAETLNLLHKG